MYLGVDIGTSGVKASAVDRDGGILASAYRCFHILGLENNYRELDPAAVADSAKSAIREAVAGSGQNRFDLILVSSLGEAVIPVDRRGRYLMNCIIGSDRRGAEDLDQLCSLISPARLAEITGLNLSVIYSLNKILYLRRLRPEVYGRTWKFLLAGDYLVHLLTGEAVLDYSMASRTLAFDLEKKCWSEEILQHADVSPELFSRPVLAGTVAGTLLPSAAADLGLSPKTKVAIGTHDHICNALGVGAVKSGHCSNAVGTTEGITAILNDRLDAHTTSANNISCQPFVLDGMYNTVAWHNTAGALVNWFLDMHYGKDRTAAETSSILAGLDQDSRHTPSSLLVLPHFSGATTNAMDDRSKGAIFGLTLGTDKNDIFRGLLEGACFECRLIVDALREAALPVDRIYVSGGGSRSSFWVQAKADILAMPVTVAREANSGALGAAVLASLVCGHCHSLEEAAQTIVKPGQEVHPIPANVALYQERYQEYRQLYAKACAASHLL